jgi:BMFP domain-containing protein YqiC
MSGTPDQRLADELTHILGHCMCRDNDQSCWYQKAWNTTAGDYDDKEREVESLQIPAILAAVQVARAGWEKEIRLDEIARLPFRVSLSGALRGQGKIDLEVLAERVAELEAKQEATAPPAEKGDSDE